MRWGIVVLLLLCSSLSWAQLDEPHPVEEPAYGEVAFLYLQGNYFAAMTRAQMALERGEVQYHRADLQVLLGAMYSAYGMPEDAEKVFSSLLDRQVSDALAQRAWVHLSGLYYRQGKYQQALNTLNQKVGDTLPAELDEVVSGLRARILMRLGRHADAAESLAGFSEQHPLNAYLRYNLAISWLKGENPAQGEQWLWELANLPAGNAETNAIKDKAILALAVHMLRNKQYDSALALLSDARIEGPFADVSLLLYARSLLFLDRQKPALAALNKLEQKSIQRPSVQEAQLALPYLFEQLDNEVAAASAYQTAVERLDKLETYLLDLEVRVASGDWFDEIVGAQQWSTSMDPLPPFLPQRTDSFPTFYEWFATPEFQQAWGQYHELIRQNNLLDQWQNTFPALYLMLESHEYKHDVLRPKARALLDTLSNQDFRVRLTRLEQRYDDAVASQQPLPFATEREEKLWQAEQEARQRVQQRGAQAGQDAVEKLDFYKGLLLWEMQEDIVPRQWSRKRELNAIGNLLEESQLLRGRLMTATYRLERLEGFRSQLPELEAMVADLQARGQQLLARQQEGLQDEALEQVFKAMAQARQVSASAHEGMADLYYRALRERRAAPVQGESQAGNKAEQPDPQAAPSP